MRSTVISLVALTYSCASAFTVTPSLRNLRVPVDARATSSVRMASLKEEDFVPSERWFEAYLGQQGLRYALNKTPKEVETEGDYTIFEKLFGQTSNNKARLDLKQKILEKANIPSDPDLYKKWTAKYGYGRFFPAYVDKSGSESSAEVTAPAPNAAKPAPAPKAQEGGGFFDSVSLPSAKPKVVVAAKPVATSRPAAKPVVAKSAPRPVAVKPKPKPVAAKPAPKPVAPKPKGNIKNLPKAL